MLRLPTFMVKKIQIQNFKSIKNLTLPAKRINIFIGEPNSGKSNILEALSLFAIPTVGYLSKLVRYDTFRSLFYNNSLKDEISIKMDESYATLTFKENKPTLDIGSNDRSFKFEPTKDGKYWWINTNGKYSVEPLIADDLFRRYKPYHFSVYSPPQEEERPLDYLQPPLGGNLFEIIESNKLLKEIVAGIVKEKGYRLNLDTSRQEINMIRDEGDVLFTYPYKSFSDTIQRVIFYLAVLESNLDSVIILEEPEANTFPYYTKYLAERIALDNNNNQFFITTHNPYLLVSLVEKTEIEDLVVNVVFMKNYATTVRQLTRDELPEILNLTSDFFFNLDEFIEE